MKREFAAFLLLALPTFATVATVATVASAQEGPEKPIDRRASAPAPEVEASDVAAAGVFVQDLLEALPPTGTAITKLSVDNRLGDVRIVGHNGPGLSIFAVKHAPDAATLERLEVTLVQDPAGPVSIRTQLAAGRGGEAIPAGSARIDLVVRVPRTARVSATVWNGKLRVKGVENGADVSTNEGPIHLERVTGAVRADSAAGSQRFEKIYGALDAHTLEGDVEVDTLHGSRLAATVTRGSVDARSVKVNEMIIRVVKGDIRVEAEVIAGGSYTITSAGGDVEARLSGSARTELAASTKRGKLQLPGKLTVTASSANEAFGYFGSGKLAARVRIRTFMGNVVVARF